MQMRLPALPTPHHTTAAHHINTHQTVTAYMNPPPSLSLSISLSVWPLMLTCDVWVCARTIHTRTKSKSRSGDDTLWCFRGDYSTHVVNILLSTTTTEKELLTPVGWWGCAGLLRFIIATSQNVLK